MRYNEDIDILDFDWFKNEPKTNELEETKWHSVNEARRIFGRNSIDEFLTQYLSYGFDTTKVQDININKIWESFKRAVVSIHGIIFYLPAFKGFES